MGAQKTIAVFFVLFILAPVFSCGPGWDGYEDNYSEPVPAGGVPWEGDETVFVVFDQTTVEVALLGMDTYDYKGASAVSLSELIINSGIIPDPENYRYNFTATDGYDLFIKRYEDLTLLPGWEEMKSGYLYLDPRFDDLTSGWDQHPWGSALSAYLVKWMNGGAITAMPMT